LNKLKLGLIVFILIGVIVSWWLAPGMIHFRQFSAAYFAQQLTPLVLVALFIGRGLEVFPTAWRGGKATDLARNVGKTEELVTKNQVPIFDAHFGGRMAQGAKTKRNPKLQPKCSRHIVEIRDLRFYC